MGMRNIAILSSILAIVTAGGAMPEEARNIFFEPKNLKVLPNDIAPDELRATMRGFTSALDLRCSSCHVGEEGQSIFEYNFAADDKELKSIAREMLRLVSDVNSRIDELDRGAGHEPVKVSCVTCHRGQDRPRMIEDILADEYVEHGVEPMMAKYRELRARYYGGFTYDFSASRLAAVAHSLSARSPEDALRVHALNIELNPDAGAAYAGRGQTRQDLGRFREAIEDYAKAASLDPEYAFLQSVIEALDAQVSQD